MSQTDVPADAGWMEARIEAYVDGDLPAAERERFEATVAADPAWRVEVRAANAVRAGLRALPHASAPPAVAAAALRRIEQIERQDRREAVRRAWGQAWAATWRPALAMGVLVAAVVTSTFVGPAPRPLNATREPSAAEVQRAVQEARWALAYLSDVGRKTGVLVRKDVIGARVVAPAESALRAPDEEARAAN